MDNIDNIQTYSRSLREEERFLTLPLSVFFKSISNIPLKGIQFSSMLFMQIHD